ncbi:hypothetical protein RZS08_46285, partial [Arthrospira platensis SPKY1]|nr:hypothetical protein [Arthrospira platensis SPKY1]
NVDQIKDSVDNSMIFFIGNVSDDYGISSLAFNYRITEKDGNISEMNSRKIDIRKEKSFDFNYLLDFSEIGLKPGQTLRYFFEVRDNDGINGPKSSFSTEMEYR